MSGAVLAPPEAAGAWAAMAAVAGRLFRPRLEIRLEAMEILLRQGRPLRLAGARGRRILCTGGCAWITAPRLLEDVVLRAGETWLVSSDGGVLVEAVGSATIRMAS
jgi:hypothetical protein